MPELILLRGLPGAGKSSLAKILSDNTWPVFSIDDYFTNAETNEYVFRFEENYLAYKLCEQNTEKAMKANVEKIFIHNTFTLEWELETYFKLADTFDYRVHVLTVENRHHSKNCHHVSDEQIIRMAEKYKVILY